MPWHTFFTSNSALLLLAAANIALLLYITFPKAAHTSDSVGASIYKTFDRDSPLQVVGSHGDDAWKNLTPARGGFLWVQTSVENIKDGHKKEEEWGISMFHGLHCLQMLRGAFQRLTEHNNVTMPGVSTTSTQHGHEQQTMDLVHIGHCLGYLADYLTCHADSTLEPPVREYSSDGRLKTNVDGLGYQHQCRDTRHLWKVAEASETHAAQPWAWRPGQRVEDLLLKADL